MKTKSNAVLVPAAFMRGGTSKGIFFHRRDLPAPREEQDALFAGVMGSPDPLQLDGMGGGVSSLSKVMIVEAGTGDWDVRYTFAQVGVDTDLVDWSGNCGNLTTAVAVFALEEGLVEPTGKPVTTVRMLNENTGVTVHATVEIARGAPRIDGNYVVPGVPGSGSPITTMYQNPGGGVLGSTFPTGKTTDELHTPAGALHVTLIDIANPHVLIRAADIGLDLSSADPAELNHDHELLHRLEDLRAAAAVRMGLAGSPDTVGEESPVLPRILILAGPVSAETDLAVLGVSLGKIHRGLMMTGALCAGAATMIRGTIAAELSTASPRRPVRLSTPLGPVEVTVDVAEHSPGPEGLVVGVGVTRTARRLMTGWVCGRPDMAKTLKTPHDPGKV